MFVVHVSHLQAGIQLLTNRLMLAAVWMSHYQRIRNDWRQPVGRQLTCHCSPTSHRWSQSQTGLSVAVYNRCRCNLTPICLWHVQWDKDVTSTYRTVHVNQKWRDWDYQLTLCSLQALIVKECLSHNCLPGSKACLYMWTEYIHVNWNWDQIAVRLWLKLIPIKITWF